MNLVYYAHSYRGPDAGVVKLFSELMGSEGLIASLDPPSDRLNSAKPERHLRSTDGMVAVLTTREGGVSRYILYEISLCLRAKKPLLVFVEDVLPAELVPPRVLQRRFSRRGWLRQVRDHRHAIKMLKSYMGDEPPPNYQPGTGPRKCLLAGLGDLPAALAESLQGHVAELGYAPQSLTGEMAPCLYETKLRENLSDADLALAFIDSRQDRAEFFLGVLHTNLTPTITLTTNADFKFHEGTPREYQARIVSYSDAYALEQMIDKEISIFEEEYVDLANQDTVARYAQLLISEGARPGQYAEGVRGLFVKELYMGDKNINYGQAGAIGRQSTGTIVNYDQVWQQIKNATNLDALASELTQLRKTLRQKAETVDQDKAVASVAEAEAEARKGNGSGVLEKLAHAGTWVLDVAKEIGASLVTEVLKKSLGM
jgi:hypothetical protein